MSDELPEKLFREWGRMATPVEDPELVGERRARVVSQIARTIRETSRERERATRIRRGLWLLAAAAVILLVAGGLLQRGRAPASEPNPAAALATLHAETAGVLHGHGERAEPASTTSEVRVAVGDVVATVADARATLGTAGGARIGIGPSSRVTLVAASAREESVELAVGEVAVSVPKLGAERSFSVQTPDARVVVHGTAFRVEVQKQGAATVTRVAVSEGSVAVHRADQIVMLTAGQSWSSAPANGQGAALAPKPGDAAPGAVDAPTAPGTEAVTATEPEHATARPPNAASLAPASKLAAKDVGLAEQNRLFAAAAAARRRGDDRGAVAQLNQLLARYPSGPLAPEARVERFRALKRLGDDAEASREARKYLLENQDGAAREEARQLALDPKKSKP